MIQEDAKNFYIFEQIRESHASKKFNEYSEYSIYNERSENMKYFVLFTQSIFPFLDIFDFLNRIMFYKYKIYLNSL